MDLTIHKCHGPSMYSDTCHHKATRYYITTIICCPNSGHLNIFPTSSLPTFLHLHCNAEKRMAITLIYNFHSIVDFFFIAVIKYHEKRSLEVEGFWGSYSSRRIKDMSSMVRKHDSRQAWLQKLLRAHSLKHKQEAQRELGMECVLETQKSIPIDTLPSSKPHFLNVGVWIKLAA